MKVINPYFNFNGSSKEAFELYQSLFGGTYASQMAYKDSPEAGKVKPEDQDKMMHISLDLGNGTVIMATDALDYMGHKVTAGNMLSLSIHTDSREEADKIYTGLSAGGKATMPMADQFWGSYFGMLKDKFGVEWLVSFEG